MSEWDFLWGLEGDALMDAMATGATREEWDDIERMEAEKAKKSEKPRRKRNTMVFIDAENIACSKADDIDRIIHEIGEVAEVRYYAMQKDPVTEGWKSTIRRYGYKPILMAAPREKNKIDDKIIRDARKILDQNKSIDIFVIVSGDGDYASLVSFLRACGKRAVALGAKQISQSLQAASSETRRV
jgi:uncharacterized LabA/DUF88 family protein